MRQIIAMLMALALILLPGALASEAGPDGGVTIDLSEPVSIDLDGDGGAETVICEMIPGEYESFLQLSVIGADGVKRTFDTGVIAGEGAWACDLDGDGAVEVFLWGDVMSDDYYTWCVRYTGDGLRPLLFADIERGENGEGYFKWGYGMLRSADPIAHTVTLCGSQDMLGTYFMCRTLTLSADGLFEREADDWWTRDVGDLVADEEAWTYGALTLKTPVACEIDGAARTLNPGEQIMITGTDKASRASFITRDGRAGTLAVSEDYERGWGWLVDGVPEEDVFEYVPYAD